MEKKYNSLKEALPSLLEEKARLEEEKSRLEARNKEVLLQIAETVSERKEIFKEHRMLLAMQALMREYDFNARSEEYIINKEEIKIAIGKYNVLCSAGQCLSDENESLRSKIYELDSRLQELDGLIQAAKDITSLASFNPRKPNEKLVIDGKDFERRFEKYVHLFNVAFNDILNAEDLTWLDRLQCIYKFSKKNSLSLSKENMNELVTNVIKTNVPAFMYLVAVKINNIPDEEMKRLIDALVASNDKKYINYLLLDLLKRGIPKKIRPFMPILDKNDEKSIIEIIVSLYDKNYIDCLLLDAYKKGISKELRSFITSLNISIDVATMFNYDDNFADELEQALLEDDYEALYNYGMYTYEDRAYVLANIQAGL